MTPQEEIRAAAVQAVAAMYGPLVPHGGPGLNDRSFWDQVHHVAHFIKDGQTYQHRPQEACPFRADAEREVPVA